VVPSVSAGRSWKDILYNVCTVDLPFWPFSLFWCRSWNQQLECFQHPARVRLPPPPPSLVLPKTVTPVTVCFVTFTLRMRQKAAVDAYS
jgi:hypothetical protein